MSRPARIFGVTTTLSGIADGLIANSYQENNTVQRAEARNEHGVLIDAAPYSKSTEISIDGLYVGSGVGVGSKVTIGGKDYLVTNSTKNEQNSDFQRGSLSLFGGDDDTVIHELSSIQSGE